MRDKTIEDNFNTAFSKRYAHPYLHEFPLVHLEKTPNRVHLLSLALLCSPTQDDGGGLIHVGGDIEPQLAPVQRLLRDVHADGGIPRRRRVDRHGAGVRHAQHRPAGQAQGSLALTEVPAKEIVVFSGGHRMLEFGPRGDLSHELVGLQED